MASHAVGLADLLAAIAPHRTSSTSDIERGATYRKRGAAIANSKGIQIRSGGNVQCDRVGAATAKENTVAGGRNAGR